MLKYSGLMFINDRIYIHRKSSTESAFIKQGSCNEHVRITVEYIFFFNLPPTFGGFNTGKNQIGGGSRYEKR